MQKVTDTFFLVHFLDDDFVNEEVTSRLKIPACSTLDDIMKALNYAIEKYTFQVQGKNPYKS